MADDMKRLESELKKGVNKRNALCAMGGSTGKKASAKGKDGKGRKKGY